MLASNHTYTIKRTHYAEWLILESDLLYFMIIIVHALMCISLLMLVDYILYK